LFALCFIARKDELAFDAETTRRRIPPELFKETIAPLLLVEHTALIGITTPMDSGCDYSMIGRVLSVLNICPIAYGYNLTNGIQLLLDATPK